MVKTYLFLVILPSPSKVFGLDPDGQEGPLKNFKLESSLMIYMQQKDNCMCNVKRGRPRSKMSSQWK